MDTNIFPPMSKKEWLEKIRADLKGKSPESLHRTLSEQWALSPFYHSEDLEEPAAPLSRALDRPQLVQYIPRGAESGEELLTALQQGVSAPWIEAPKEWKAFWTEQSEVQWNMITPILQPPLPSDEDLPEHPNNHLDRFYLSGENKHQLNFRQQTGKFHFPIPHSTEADLPKTLGNWLLQIVQQLDELSPEQASLLFQNALHQKQLSHAFYFELAAIRAMRLLAGALQRNYELPKNTPISIWAQIGRPLQLSTVQESLIAYTSAAFSAVCAGADFIYIDAHQEGSDTTATFQKRMARNIFHLLDMESHAFHVMDPAAGSYALETLSRDIAQKAWSYFLSQLSDD
jgi:methylmalonyl-CoA mutase